METDTAFIRANGIIELNAITEVVLNITFVVDPGDAECQNTIGLDHALNDLVLFEFGVLVVDVFNAHQHFLNGLEIFFFSGVLCLEGSHDIVNFHNQVL